MMRIAIHGSPGAGHRLIVRMLDASPDSDRWSVEAFHLPGRVSVAHRYILPVRSPEALRASILKEGMVRTRSQADSWIRQAKDTQRKLAAMYDTLSIRYETMVKNGAGPTIERLANWLGVEPWDFDEDIYDGNAQYQ